MRTGRGEKAQMAVRTVILAVHATGCAYKEIQTNWLWRSQATMTQEIARQRNASTVTYTGKYKEVENNIGKSHALTSLKHIPEKLIHAVAAKDRGQWLWPSKGSVAMCQSDSETVDAEGRCLQVLCKWTQPRSFWQFSRHVWEVVAFQNISMYFNYPT